MHPVPFSLRSRAAVAPRHLTTRTSRVSLRVTALAAVSAIVGCASYTPEPLSPASELLELRERSLASLEIERPDGAEPAAAADFDATDGIDEVELVSIALTLNPALREKRAALGESQALLVTAGLWPNPELGVSLHKGIGAASGVGANLDLLFELLRPGERSARQNAAAARIESVEAELGAEEYRVAADARKSRIELIAAEQFLEASEAESSLRDNALSMVERRRGLGEASTLDVALLELERAESQRALREARAEVELRRRALLAAVGLPPGFALQLSDAKLSVTLYEDMSDEDLDQGLLSQRLDLRAVEAAYRSAEEELRLAVLRQYPNFAVGPSFQRDVDGTDSLGIGASSDVPIFNRNEGEIAEKTAARSRVRATYSALLYERRREAFEARALLRRAREELETQQRDVQPVIERTDSLFTAAFDARELTAFEWVTARGRTLVARRELLRASVRYVSAVAELEAAIGGPLRAAKFEQPSQEQR